MRKKRYLRRCYRIPASFRCAFRLNVRCMRSGVIVSTDLLKFGRARVLTVVSSRFLIFRARPEINLKIPSWFELSVKKNGFLKSPVNPLLPVLKYRYNIAKRWRGFLKRSFGRPKIFEPAFKVCVFPFVRRLGDEIGLLMFWLVRAAVKGIGTRLRVLE